MVNFLFSLQDFYTEGVGQFQSRVELWQPWDQVGVGRGYPERVCFVSEPLQGLMRYWNFFVPGLPKLNPGLKFANTFGVGFSYRRPFRLRPKPRCVISVFS